MLSFFTNPLRDFCCSGAEAMPELQGFEPLPVHELAVRLCFMYQHRQEHPVVDSLAQEDILGLVDPESVDLLCKYLYFADQAYDCGTEANLKRLLGDYGGLFLKQQIW